MGVRKGDSKCGWKWLRKKWFRDFIESCVLDLKHNSIVWCETALTFCFELNTRFGREKVLWYSCGVLIVR